MSSAAKINMSRLKSRYWALTATQWLTITRAGIATVPKISTSQLEKLDKGGALVKFLALLQVGYLIVQLIARKVGGLPSAQLEIGALAFASCSAITYLLYWKRPQGVETIYKIEARRFGAIKRQKQILEGIARNGPNYLRTAHGPPSSFYPEIGPDPVPNDAAMWTSFSFSGIVGDNYDLVTLSLGALFGGTLLGGIHCLAWHFHFPTAGEALGWKICSIATTCLPVLSIAPISVWMTLNPQIGMEDESPLLRMLVASTGLGIFTFPYVLARLFLLVEMFRTLCYLSPEAFVDTWSGSFPHLG